MLILTRNAGESIDFKSNVQELKLYVSTIANRKAKLEIVNEINFLFSVIGGKDTTIFLGGIGDVKIVIINVTNNSVCLGIEAPKNVNIKRTEIINKR